MPATASLLFAGVDFAPGRLFDTTDRDEACSLSARVFNPHQLAVLGRDQALHARLEHLRLGPLSLNRLTWGADVGVDPDRLDSYYLLSMPTRGRARFEVGGRCIEVTTRSPGLVSAAPRFRFTATHDFEQIVVRVERAAVEAGWRALSGRDAPAPIDFACAVPTDGGAWRALSPVLSLLARCAEGAWDARALPHLQARLADLFVTTLLLHQPHSLAPPVAAPRATPLHLRRAQAFMSERLHEPLTLSDVARAGGVPSRTLQAAFQQAHGMGPMQWLREQRLHAVRAELLGGPGGPPRITETAMGLGFTHLGEFSRAYRRAFGETPSRTLQRRR